MTFETCYQGSSTSKDTTSLAKALNSSRLGNQMTNGTLTTLATTTTTTTTTKKALVPGTKAWEKAVSAAVARGKKVEKARERILNACPSLVKVNKLETRVLNAQEDLRVIRWRLGNGNLSPEERLKMEERLVRRSSSLVKAQRALVVLRGELGM